MINWFNVFEVKRARAGQPAIVCRKYGNQKLSCKINISNFLATADSALQYGSKR